MKENRMKDALESIARRGVPDDVNLMPNIAARLERKSLMQTFRARPVLAALLILLTLALLSGAVYAIGRATGGYIPGIGFIDQSAPLRVLAEPVTVTRDGITLTVDQVVLSADKTVLKYKVEGIPADAYSNDKDTEDVSNYSRSIVTPLEGTPEVVTSIIENANFCSAVVRLRPPDGSILGLRYSEGSGWGAEGGDWISGYEYRIVYGPFPRDVKEATFMMSCVDGTTPGRLPGNWEVPLRFVPAPPDMNILPVLDVASSATAPDTSQTAMTIEKVIETADGYIVTGRFRSIGLPMNAKAQGLSSRMKITDANGQMVDATLIYNMEPSNVFGEIPWGYEVKGKLHAWPLTFTIDTVNVLFEQQTTEFEFNTGPNPQVGQKWSLDKDVQFAGYVIRVVSIERTPNGYSFIFKADPDVTNVTAEIKSFPYTSAGGWNDGYGHGDLFFTIEFKEEPPSGKLTIELGWLNANIHGRWQVKWNPENMPSAP